MKGGGNMEKLAPVIMCALFAILAFFLMKLTLKITSSAAKRKILSYSRPSENAVLALLEAEFGESNVITGRCLPQIEPDGTKSVGSPGTFVVMGSCVVCVEILSAVGKIDSDEEYKWFQSVRTRSGEMKETSFPSPVFQSDNHTKSLRALLERNRMSKVRVYGMIIFTSRNADFSKHYSQVFYLSEAMDHLKKLSKEKRFTKKQRIGIVRMINKNSRAASKITGKTASKNIH